MPEPAMMRIAMVGAGGIARRHLGVLVNEPEVVIAAHTGGGSDSANENARVYGGSAYPDVGSMLEAERIDAAWVCVPPGSHGEIERALIAREIPFLVEKPLAADDDSPQVLAKEIAASGLPVAVGYHFRALDTLDELRQTLAANRPQMVIGAWHGSMPGVPWWRKQALSGGQTVEQATHLFDLARFLLGEAAVEAALAKHPPEPVLPGADVAGVSAALLRFVDGVPGSFTSTCLLAVSTPAHLQLVSEGLLVTVTQQAVTYERAGERREVRTGTDPFMVENRAFLEAVRTGNDTGILSKYADALQTHRLCCAVRAAAGG
ncbi:MAG: Gfo/Idh/MocA family protein [Thermomicrobiales bacterium]